LWQAGQCNGTAQSGSDSNCTVSVLIPVETDTTSIGHRIMMSGIAAFVRRIDDADVTCAEMRADVALSVRRFDVALDLGPDALALVVTGLSKLDSFRFGDRLGLGTVTRLAEARVHFGRLVCRDPH
jgi:hypothetical protein